MDALVKLALMAKASAVVAADDPEKFLAFPALTPFSYPPERLRFAAALATAQDWRDYSEFSRVVNRVVRGPLYDPTAEPLEDVVRDILRDGEAASSGLFSAPDEAAYRAALETLYENPDAAPRRPSAAARLYGQFRDAHIRAVEHLRERADTVARSGDAEAQAAFAAVEEPALRRTIADYERDWAERGNRAAIDAARAVERARAAARSRETWAEWRSQFNADLDMPTDVMLNRFAATAFTPADIVDAGDWNALSVERAAFQQLLAEAPAALREALAPEGLSSDVESLSMQIRTVGLDRPWLPRDLFTSRIWRFTDGRPPLSEGGEALAGRCPAYPVGLVFARDIRVTRVGAPPDRKFRRLAVAQLFAATPVAPTVEARPLGVRGALGALLFPGGEDAHRVMVRGPAATVVRDHRRPPGPVIRDHRIPRRPGPRVPPAPRPTPTTSPPPPPTPVHDEPDPNITILAFICRRLPLSPDPDSALF